MAEDTTYKGALKQEKALPHGAYNALAVSQNPKKQALDYLSYDPILLLKDELLRKNTPDVFDAKTEWNAIVLKVIDEITIFHNPLTVALSSLLTPGKEDKIRFYGLIPELHGCLLTPVDEKDVLALSQYPVFEGAAALGTVVPGDLVRVTFDNLNNFSGPKYIGPASGKANIVGLGSPSYLNAAGAFANGAGTPWSDFDSKQLPTFSAWTGAAALSNPEQTLKIAQLSKMKLLDIFVNDHPGPKKFYTYDEQQIRKAVAYLQAAGLDIWLTTWIKPHTDWIEGMRFVGRLAEEVGAKGITLDMEDPWMYGFRPGVTGEEIDQWNIDLFNALRESFTGQIAVSVIINQNDIHKVKKALELCDVIIPQAYATKANAGNRPPGGLEVSTVNIFQKYGKPLIMGAMAFRLDGAYGMDRASAIQTSINATRGLGISEIRYWRLESFWDDTVREVLRAQK